MFIIYGGIPGEAYALLSGTEDRESIRFFITSSLSILCGIHLCCTTALTFYSAIEIKIRLYSYHYQMVLGVLVAFTGIVSWRTKCHGSVSRAMNVAGAAFALLMLAATIFGVFCWFHR
ncbi:hypothetical protein COOONC_09475 [Cooperia oncophora]